MPPIATEIVLILFLVLLNGVFAMAEIAIVSARKSRLRQRAAEGDAKAATALHLAESPNLFLSTVQVGVTLIGVVLGAIGGASVANVLANTLSTVPAISRYATPLALGIVLATITYLSIVLGELVPKRLALNDPERVASLLAPLMRFASRLGAPLVYLLSASTHAVMRVLGVQPSLEPPVTDEEIHALFEEGTEAGVFEAAEQHMVKGILLLGDRRASALMTPRPDIVWIDVEDTEERVRQQMEGSPYSRFPVGRGSLDDVVGEMHAKDLLLHIWDGKPFDVSQVLRTPLYIPETMPVLTVLETFKQAGTQMALVINEYGGVEGLLTLTDILEAIVGDMPSADESEEAEAVQREDGSWLIDGMLPIDEFKGIMSVDELPGDEQGLYQTVAGFMLMQFGHLPSIAETFEWDGLCFEVVDMVGPRLNRVLVSHTDEAERQEPTVDADNPSANGRAREVY